MKTLLILACAAVSLITANVVQGQQAAESAVKEKSAGVKNVEVNEADRLLTENKKIVILDVRTPKEYAQGHLAGAKNIDFYARDFERKLQSLDKSKTYLVHCAVGGRSAKARDLMKKLKFESIYHLEGGIKAWEQAGKPVQTK